MGNHYYSFLPLHTQSPSLLNFLSNSNVTLTPIRTNKKIKMKPQIFFILIILTLFPLFLSQDLEPMLDLKRELNPSIWADTGSDYCNWKQVRCDKSNRVTVIQLGNQGLKGKLPDSLAKLNALVTLELQSNQIGGPLVSLAGFGNLKSLLLSENNFTAIPADFFKGMTSLETVYLDKNPFSTWVLPESLQEADKLVLFSAVSSNLAGPIPNFVGNIVGLTTLHLSLNNLEGGLPEALAQATSIQSLWVNGQNSPSKLNGSISVLQNMQQLTEVWLHGNQFSGPLPDFTTLTQLKSISFRDNLFTGLIPESLIKLQSLKVVNLSNNMFQGPTPKFGQNVSAEITGINSFCLTEAGVNCDYRVNTMLSVAKFFGYPIKFAQNWKGNDPCSPNSWPGISCRSGNINVVNFQNMGLSGTISPDFSQLESLEKLYLSKNNITGTIPNELINLKNLTLLDVSNNNLSGKVPQFRKNVLVITDGNPNIGRDIASPPPPGTPGVPPGGGPSGDSSSKKISKGATIGIVVSASVIGLGVVVLFLCWAKRKRLGKVQSPNTVVVHPRHSGSDREVKITIANNVGANGSGGTASETYSLGSSGPSDIHVIEAGTMVISIQVLRNVTNNFSEENILGRGGFGTVYKGELHDGTKIAVKRMESGVVTEKGLDEFKSEIAVLTKVRHRHLVTLLGYCLEGNERLLVYEYMPQGTLSRYLFSWRDEGLRPLEWSKRLVIALDVARGVEYLHGLAHQSFIHRDLKPSNILLGDDLRAKVADFGLVRLAPDGKASVVTRLAGTFGYLAPEYAVTGRVTTKIDVFSFGVILMELITGRRALDETQQEESVHLVTWFRRMHLDKDTFRKAIDPSLDELDEGTLASITTVAELAGHCSAREPSQRPDMGHVVNVLSSLSEMWKPTEMESEDLLGIDFDMSLPQALKKWKALEGGVSGIDSTTSSSASYLASGDNTQTSLPNRPTGFAASFTSADGR